MLRFSVVSFDELSPQALYDVLTLRQRVFVVEQRCAYLDCDGRDSASVHLLGYDARSELTAYARIVPPGVSFEEASIGRVLARRDARGAGLGRALMREAIAQTTARFGRPIRIGAQRYLEAFYAELGFVVAGAPYDEDGIAHVEMLLA